MKKPKTKTPYKYGRVHWFSDEGLGYIVEDNKSDSSVLFHYSTVKKLKKDEYIMLKEGQPVKFKSNLFDGREVATEVKRIKQL